MLESRLEASLGRCWAWSSKPVCAALLCRGWVRLPLASASYFSNAINVLHKQASRCYSRLVGQSCVYNETMPLQSLSPPSEAAAKPAHSVDLRTSEFDDGVKKGAKRCGCAISPPPEHSAARFQAPSTTACTEWDRRPAPVAAQMGSHTGSWGTGGPPTPQAASTSETKPDHITITHATEAFLAKCVNRGIRPNTIAKYQNLHQPAQSLGHRYRIRPRRSAQLSPTWTHFMASWKDGIRARAKKARKAQGVCPVLHQAQMANREYRRRPSGARRDHQSQIRRPRSPTKTFKRLLAACDRIKRTPRRDWDGEDLQRLH
jgi:hypothetical protein